MTAARAKHEPGRDIHGLAAAILNRFVPRPLRPLWTRLLQSPLGRRMARGAVWSMIGSGIAQALGFLASVITARMLGTAHFGELGIVLSTTHLFTNVAALGLGVTATKHIAQYRDRQREKAGQVIGMSAVTSAVSGLLVAATLLLLAPWLAADTLKAPQLAPELRLAAVMMYFGAVNSYQSGVLSGFEAFRTVAAVNLLRGLINLPVIVIGVSWGQLPGAVAAYATMSLVSYLLSRAAVMRECARQGIRVRYRFTREDFALLWRFSLPVLLSSFSFAPAVWGSQALLARRAGFEALGVFSAAMQMYTVMMFFANAVSVLGLPMLSNVGAERDYHRYRKVLLLNFALTAGLALVMAVPIAIGAPWIMHLYGRGFAAGTWTLVLICVSTVLTAANMPVGQAIWSLNAARAGMGLAFLRGATLLAAAYFLTPLGSVGLALSYVLMGLVQTSAQVPFVLWLLRRQRARWTAQPAPAVAPTAVGEET